MGMSDQFHGPGPFIPGDRAPGTHNVEELSPGIEARLICCPARHLVIVLIELTAMLYVL